MALDARLRSSIYQSLVPILGAEEANALMSEFPAREADELVTKQFLRAELGTLRAEMLSMENRLTLRIGAAMAAQTALLAALRLLG
jgi:hypothetical protein